MTRPIGLLQLARELEETARIVSGILRVVQGHAKARPVRLVAAPARGRVPVPPVVPGEVRRVRVEYIPPHRPKRKRG